MTMTESEPLASGDTVRVDFWYPRSQDPKYIVVGLVDVRAADAIRVSYDFDRDGYVIEQASRFEWPVEDKVCDQGWAEVAFVKAWARDEREK